MRNNFSEETKSLFVFNEKCFFCGQNDWDCFHHILGRISDNSLNVCPLHNFKCHIGNGKLNTFKVQKELLKKTLNYLLESGYKLTKKDKDFIKKNKIFYD